MDESTDWRVCKGYNRALVTGHPSSHNPAAAIAPLLLAILLMRNLKSRSKNKLWPSGT
jgi:hypothetical protein